MLYFSLSLQAIDYLLHYHLILYVKPGLAILEKYKYIN